MINSWTVSRRAWVLSTQAYEAGPGESSKFKRHLRWAATAAVRQALAHDWFTFLDEPGMKPFVAANPRLAFRPMGTYMSTRWDWTRRIKVIRDTYGFVHAQGGALREALIRPEGMVLARVNLEKAGEVAVRLRADAQFRKEGEIGVFLEFTKYEGAVSAFAFSLEHRGEAGWACYVGAVQGRKGGDEEVIKAATKAMYGFRPKLFMVFLVQEIVRSLKVKALLGVGNGIHVFRSRLLGPPKKITFDYDELWKEAGGESRPDGWFALPLRTGRRADEDVKPNKRSMYAKRYALMDALSRQIRTALTAG